VIVDLARREIVHIGVTSSPSAQYAEQCFVEAVADRDNENPQFMIRDRVLRAARLSLVPQAIGGKHVARDSCVSSLLSRVRAPDPGEPCDRLPIGIISADTSNPSGPW
jgi:hypothetical protein